MDIRKILLPLDLLENSLPIAVIRQAAALAHHFHAEILVLHVVKPLTYVASSKVAHELLEQAVSREQEKFETCLGPELDGLSVRRLVLKGDPARETLRTAHDENINLIVMPTHGYGAVKRFLVGSVTTKVLHQSECPVWTGVHLEDAPGRKFAIRNVLCAVDFSPHSRETVRWAQAMATEFGAQLTLAHITPGVEIYGPGGSYVLPEMKEALVSSATKLMSKLQQEMGTKAEVFIASGDVPKMISEAANKTNADLLIVRCRSRGARLGTHGYGIIRESHIPVLSV
jgi:nucleotide-binding universal stress UspA family protein